MPNPFLNSLFIRNLHDAANFLNDDEKADVICICNKIIEHCLLSDRKDYGKITARINSDHSISYLRELGFLVQQVEDDPELKQTYDVYIPSVSANAFRCGSLDTAEDIYRRLIKEQVEQVIKQVSKNENLTVSVLLNNPGFKRDVVSVLISLGYYIKPDKTDFSLVYVSLLPFSEEEHENE